MDFMCGRYGRRADKQQITEWFRTHNTNVFEDPELAPHLQCGATELPASDPLEFRNGRARNRANEMGLGAVLVKDREAQIQQDQCEGSALTN
jgi:hypothetical protein